MQSSCLVRGMFYSSGDKPADPIFSASWLTDHLTSLLNCLNQEKAWWCLPECSKGDWLSNHAQKEFVTPTHGSTTNHTSPDLWDVPIFWGLLFYICPQSHNFPDKVLFPEPCRCQLRTNGKEIFHSAIVQQLVSVHVSLHFKGLLKILCKLTVTRLKSLQLNSRALQYVPLKEQVETFRNCRPRNHSSLCPLLLDPL